MLSEVQRATPPDARGVPWREWQAKHGVTWDAEECRRWAEAHYAEQQRKEREREERKRAKRKYEGNHTWMDES